MMSFKTSLKNIFKKQDPAYNKIPLCLGFSTRLQSLLLATSSSCTISDPEKIETNDVQIISIVGGCIGLIVLLLIAIFVTVAFKQKISKRYGIYSFDKISPISNVQYFHNRHTMGFVDVWTYLQFLFK